MNDDIGGVSDVGAVAAYIHSYQSVDQQEANERGLGGEETSWRGHRDWRRSSWKDSGTGLVSILVPR